MWSRRAVLGIGAACSTSLVRSAEPGFVSLFDGVSLAGWSVREGPESAFHVRDGAIAVHRSANFPAWLRSDKEYENFDFRGEFFLQGWMDSGIYLHAPLHGRNTWTGFEIKLFHQQEQQPTPYSCGAVFPLIAPRLVKVNNKGEWNTFRILFDWPRLSVWINGELVQDLDVETHPELRVRLRRGYLGFQSLSYPIRFRNLQIRELPAKENWQALFVTSGDLANWTITDAKPRYEAIGGVLRLEGLGDIGTKELFRDFELHCYIRTSRWHNGGVLFRGGPGRQRYEIQLHNVEGAHFPTGSLYHYKRAVYPRIEDEKWWLMQLLIKGRAALVRINGETVLEYDALENREPGPIALQAHAEGTWAEFKNIRVKRL
jgi:hypothetical protein